MSRLSLLSYSSQNAITVYRTICCLNILAYRIRVLHDFLNIFPTCNFFLSIQNTDAVIQHALGALSRKLEFGEYYTVLLFNTKLILKLLYDSLQYKALHNLESLFLSGLLSLRVQRVLRPSEVGHFKEVHITFSCYACQFQIHFQLRSGTQIQVHLNINFYVFHLIPSATEHLFLVFYVAESTKINKPKENYLTKKHFCIKRDSACLSLCCK